METEPSVAAFGRYFVLQGSATLLRGGESGVRLLGSTAISRKYSVFVKAKTNVATAPHAFQIIQNIQRITCM